eukprot:2519634-Prymnesium_polylepis.1
MTPMVLISSHSSTMSRSSPSHPSSISANSACNLAIDYFAHATTCMRVPPPMRASMDNNHADIRGR